MSETTPTTTMSSSSDPGSSNPGSDSPFTLTEAAATVAESVRLLVVPTAADDESFDRARRVAVQIAGNSSRPDGCTVVLYDRSDERWTDTPHPEGPIDADDVDSENRPHLVDQMAEFTNAGIEVKAWYASVPAITEVLVAVQHLGADALVVPESIDKPRVMDRLQPGDDAGEQVGRVLDQNLDRSVHVFVVGDDDNVEVLATVGNTERPD